MNRSVIRLTTRLHSVVLPMSILVVANACSESPEGPTLSTENGTGSLSTTVGTESIALTTTSTAPTYSTTAGPTSAGASGTTGGGSSSTTSGGDSGGPPGPSGASSASSDSTSTGGTAQGSAADGSSSSTVSSGGGIATSSNAGSDSTQDSDNGVSGSGKFHIFLLMGQSNMAGVAKFDAGDKNTDERIRVLGGCNQPAGQWNVANPPLSDCPGEKGWNPSDSVDPGIWFAKTLVEKLPAGDTIGLVGTAESGESINTFISGGSHHQMILNKIAQAKTAENARFAGVIFHQGESDSGQNTWPDKVVQLYNEVKEAWGVDYDVPFILGELPSGGCCSGHNSQVHAAADKLPMGSWVSQEGTNVLDQYHFDHASVVLMGQRYGEKMIAELGW